MWFKNLIIYRLPELWPDDKTKLQAALYGAPFAPCTGLDWFSEGFAAPMPFEPDLVFAAGRSQRVALKREDKVLPGAVVRDLLITQERNRGGVCFYTSAQNQYEYAVCVRYIKPREKRDRILYYSPINQALGEKVLSIR